MDIKEAAEKIKEFLADGNTEDAIKTLVEFTKDTSSERYEDAILLSGQYKQWKRESLLGIEQTSSELRRIEMSILSILRDKENPMPEPEPKAQISSKKTGPKQAQKDPSSNKLIYIVGAGFLLIAAILVFWMMSDSNQLPTPQSIADNSFIFNAKWYLNNNPDIMEKGFTGEEGSRKHFVNHGIEEGRQSSPDFDVNFYRKTYPELEEMYGNDFIKYYQHYLLFGKEEGLKTVEEKPEPKPAPPTKPEPEKEPEPKEPEPKKPEPKPVIKSKPAPIKSLVGVFAIKISENENYCLNGNDRTAQGSSCQNGDGQLWIFESTGDGLYYLKNKAGGPYKCLDSNGQGGNVSMTKCTGADSQLWKIETTSDGHFQFKSNRRSLEGTPKTNTTMGRSNNAKKQMWTLERIR